jgi:hypothetical protein
MKARIAEPSLGGPLSRSLLVVLAWLVVALWPQFGRAQVLDPAAPETGAAEAVTAPDAPAEGEAEAGAAAEVQAAPDAAPAPASEQGRAADAAPKKRKHTWTGPHVELSYRVFSLRDDQGGRTANVGSFAGFLPTRKFRGGGGVQAGSRVFEYGANEGLLSGYVFAGYQHLGGDLGRVVPYVVAVGELGALFGKRFHTPMTQLVRGAGMELGADVNLVRGLYMGLGVGFMLYTIDHLAYSSWGLRLSIGL